MKNLLRCIPKKKEKRQLIYRIMMIPIRKKSWRKYITTLKNHNNNNNNNNFCLSTFIDENENTDKRKLIDSSFNETEQKRQKRKTTPQEHTILDPLVAMNDKPTENQINEAINEIGCDRRRLVDYITRHRRRKEIEKNK
jgi:hypothetical protein